MRRRPTPVAAEGWPCARFRGAKRYSLGEQFRRHDEADEAALQVRPWYARCIKSNHKKRANLFENRVCLDQLRYSGDFEAVKIRKNGYPFRYTHAQFASRFRCITLDSRMRSALRSHPGDHRALLGVLSHEALTWQVKTRATWSSTVQPSTLLELLRHLALEKIVPMAQRAARGFNARRFVRVLRQAGRILLVPSTSTCRPE